MKELSRNSGNGQVETRNGGTDLVKVPYNGLRIEVGHGELERTYGTVHREVPNDGHTVVFGGTQREQGAVARSVVMPRVKTATRTEVTYVVDLEGDKTAKPLATEAAQSGHGVVEIGEIDRVLTSFTPTEVGKIVAEAIPNVKDGAESELSMGYVLGELCRGLATEEGAAPTVNQIKDAAHRLVVNGHGISLTDAQRDATDQLFPGEALTRYSPELNRVNEFLSVVANGADETPTRFLNGHRGQDGVRVITFEDPSHTASGARLLASTVKAVLKDSSKRPNIDIAGVVIMGAEKVDPKVLEGIRKQGADIGAQTIFAYGKMRDHIDEIDDYDVAVLLPIPNAIVAKKVEDLFGDITAFEEDSHSLSPAGGSSTSQSRQTRPVVRREEMMPKVIQNGEVLLVSRAGEKKTATYRYTR